MSKHLQTRKHEKRLIKRQTFLANNPYECPYKGFLCNGWMKEEHHNMCNGCANGKFVQMVKAMNDEAK
jgi:hypothetical protein